MRDVEKNKRLIYYSSFDKTTPIIDGEGNLTGEDNFAYGEIFPLRINTSPPSGSINTKAFGKNIDCDRVLFTCRKNLPITQKTVFWIDDLNTDHPHDYEIAGISEGMTAMIYAVRRVTVS